MYLEMYECYKALFAYQGTILATGVMLYFIIFTNKIYMYTIWSGFLSLEMG